MRGSGRFLAAILLAGAVGSTAVFARHLGTVPELGAVHLAAPPLESTPALQPVRAALRLPLRAPAVPHASRHAPATPVIPPPAAPTAAPSSSHPAPRRPAPARPHRAAPAAGGVAPRAPQPVEPALPVRSLATAPALEEPTADPSTGGRRAHGRDTAPGQLKKLVRQDGGTAGAGAETKGSERPTSGVPVLPPSLPGDAAGDEDGDPPRGNGNGRGRGHEQHE
jgi:hypothetical protein